jgi:membrane protease YdiL (CAAX protease family)
MGSSSARAYAHEYSKHRYGKQDLKMARTRRRDLSELAVAYGLILLVIWTPRPWQWLLLFATVASIVTMAGLSFDGLEAMGLSRANFLCPLWAIGATVGVAAAAVLLAIRFHTLHFAGTPFLFARHSSEYALWAWAQEALLQCFCLSRLLRLVHSATLAATIAAVMFAVVHLPSPVLTAVALICGMAACLVFLRYRNLYTVAVAHAILGTSLATCIPAPVIRNMEVGLGYLTYAPTHARFVRSAASAAPHAMSASRSPSRSLQP